MTIEQIREFHRAQPFQSFLIRLADGRGIAVAHPDYLMPSPNRRTVAVYQPDGCLNVIDVMLVTDLEIGANGTPAEPS